MKNTLNLQLFANEVQTTLLSGLSAEMKTFYDMTLIDEAGPQLVHDQFGQKRPIPQNGGKNIEFRGNGFSVRRLHHAVRRAGAYSA